MTKKTVCCLVLLVSLCGCSALATPPAMTLHEAALTGNLEVVQQHIAAGSDLNEKDAWGSTPLIVAATFGTTEVAVALIEAGADLNVPNGEGSTPLHVAAFFCRTEIVRALLDKGADRELRNSYGHTAFDSVSAPFAEVKGIYEAMAESLGPLGLVLDFEQLETTRPKIAAMLQP